MSLKLSTCTVILLGLLSALNLSSQKGWELGGWLGGSHYFGDLNTNFDLMHPGLAGGLIGRYNLNHRLSGKVSLNYGSIRASDEYSDNNFEKQRNLSFKSHIFDFSAQFEFNFLPYVHGTLDRNFSPYIFLGIAGFRFNPTAEFNGTRFNLQPLGTEGQADGDEYELYQLAGVGGLGIKFDLNYRWSINVEFSARQLFTDYLDDVSTVYPDMARLRAIRGSNGDLAVNLSDRSAEILNDPIGKAGSQRGNSRDDDRYTFIGIGLLYYIGILQCPDINKF